MNAHAQVPNILSIAGTDPSGGAGIQADLKSIAANGGYGMAVVTALVAQNTNGVRDVHVPPTAFLEQQLDAVSDDVRIDAVKIGMLANTDVIRAVTAWLQRVQPAIVVLDPVMVATSGDRLLDSEAEDALRALLGSADIVTPNISELAILVSEEPAESWAGVLQQAEQLALRHGVRVLAKGGHLDGEDAPDALVEPLSGQLGASGLASAGAGAGAVSVTEFRAARIKTANTHGTGCSLASALATRVALSSNWPQAVGESKRWLTESIRHSEQLSVGSGRGPIHHFGGLWQRAGTHTAASAPELAEQWWHQISDVRSNIDDLAFIRRLGDGTLDRDAFRWYLAQDALYLRDYSRVLSEASKLAPTAHEQAFWARGALGALTVEMQLHESWVSQSVLDRVCPSTTTASYLSHLLLAGARGDYNTLIAALLPCYWLYHDVGTRLHPLSHDAHPYRSWLDSYADEEFAASTAEAVSIVTRAAALASESERQAMFRAFRVSSEHELAFFAAPLLGEQSARPRDAVGTAFAASVTPMGAVTVASSKIGAQEPHNA